METTVTSCTKVKEWNGKPIYSVELSDGTKGQSFATEIPVGTASSEITIEETEKYGKNFKLNKQKGGGFNSKPKGNESFALAYAKDIAVALINKADKAPKSEDIAKVAIAIADPFYNWLQSKKQ